MAKKITLPEIQLTVYPLTRCSFFILNIQLTNFKFPPSPLSQLGTCTTYNRSNMFLASRCWFSYWSVRKGCAPSQAYHYYRAYKLTTPSLNIPPLSQLVTNTRYKRTNIFLYFHCCWFVYQCVTDKRDGPQTIPYPNIRPKTNHSLPYPTSQWHTVQTKGPICS